MAFVSKVTMTRMTVKIMAPMISFIKLLEGIIDIIV
jgi:hypothetical protein